MISIIIMSVQYVCIHSEYLPIYITEPSVLIHMRFIVACWHRLKGGREGEGGREGQRGGGGEREIIKFVIKGKKKQLINQAVKYYCTSVMLIINKYSIPSCGA